jgi:hypothetical protein
MTIPNYKYQARAEKVARRRKEFLGELIVVILIGGIFGYYSGLFFAQFLEADLNHPGFLLGTWGAMRETFLAVMSIFGIMIWPAIFSGCYLFWRRRTDAKLAAESAIYDEEARDARIAATERRIAEAQKRGEL